MASPQELYPGWTRGVAALAGVVLALATSGGVVAALAGWRPGLALAGGAALAVFALHLATGIVGYRRAMAREWPRVEPLDDDAWD